MIFHSLRKPVLSWFYHHKQSSWLAFDPGARFGKGVVAHGLGSPKECLQAIRGFKANAGLHMLYPMTQMAYHTQFVAKHLPDNLRDEFVALNQEQDFFAEDEVHVYRLPNLNDKGAEFMALAMPDFVVRSFEDYKLYDQFFPVTATLDALVLADFMRRTALPTRCLLCVLQDKGLLAFIYFDHKGQVFLLWTVCHFSNAEKTAAYLYQRFLIEVGDEVRVDTVVTYGYAGAKKQLLSLPIAASSYTLQDWLQRYTALDLHDLPMQSLFLLMFMLLEYGRDLESVATPACT